MLLFMIPRRKVFWGRKNWIGLRIYDHSRGGLRGLLDQAEEVRLGGAGEGGGGGLAALGLEHGLGHTLVRREVEEVGDGGGGDHGRGDHGVGERGRRH